MADVVDEASGFLGRWARRKADARLGKPLPEPDPPMSVVVTPSTVATTTPELESGERPQAPAAAPTIPVPTLEDTKALTKDSDFTPFMGRQVGPEVRNAAMKKLFADPQFNVMDGLDTYIDDYSKSEPIPESMLRQMVGAQFLNLFDASPGPVASADLRESAEPVEPQSVAQSTAKLQESNTDHDHTHLQLQPDHADRAPDPGSGAA